MLIASLSLLSVFVTAFWTSSSDQKIMSLDWAGYVVVSDFANPDSIITSVTGSWTVPQVSASIEDTFSATWIGIGGQLDNTLIQTGTEHDSINGNVMYSAWYELLPNYAVAIPTINVSQGDKITASIRLDDSTTNKWSIEIVDVTKEQSFEEDFFYNSARLSGEWIVERPTVDNRLSTLADFGSIAFTNASVTLNANFGGISSFPYSRITMYDRRNRQLATVSSLSSDGSSFTVKYLENSTPTGSQMNRLLETVNMECQEFTVSSCFLTKSFSFLIGVCNCFISQDAYNLCRSFLVNDREEVDFFPHHNLVSLQDRLIREDRNMFHR